MVSERSIFGRAKNKAIREFSEYFDSYSFYFNMPPSSKNIGRLGSYAKVSPNVMIPGKIITPTPSFIEIGEGTSLESLQVAREKYLFIERGVNQPEGIVAHDHTVVTKNNIYTGSFLGSNEVTVSVDFEGGVALSHANKESWDYLARFWDSREAALKLSKLFQKYEIPVTWAICGHLFLNSCAGNHEFEEPDWFGDWFQYDPCSNRAKDPSWYMPDVIEELIKIPYFEIGYHTFGHFRYRCCSEKTVRRDVELANQIRKQWGIKLNSFVFPYNECGRFDLLRDYGFTNIRGNIGRVYPSYGIINFKDFIFYNTTEMVAPKTLDRCLQLLDSLGNHVANYYTHCYQWGEHDGWQKLEEWIKNISHLRDIGKITLKKMGDSTTWNTL